MKKNSKIKIVLAVAAVALFVASFFVGKYAAEQKDSTERLERCKTLISFAMDKAENDDITDQEVLRGIISNVYAAYQFCDYANAANQLHDLWNYLIFESDKNAENLKEYTLYELDIILTMIGMHE